MKTEEIKISIIIINYRVKEELFECIKSIYNSKQKIKFEIIVVDNDEKKVIGKDLVRKFPKVIYIKSPKNLGYGAGNNLGVKHAKGEYLFFLNPDTKVLDEALDNLYDFFAKKNNVRIISPVLVDNNLNPFKSQGSKELSPENIIFSQSFLRKIFPKKNIYNENALASWNMKKPREVDAVPGAAMMISSSFFRKIGGFDEKFFLYFEENDISKRVRKLGFKLFIVKSARIINLFWKSTRNINNIEDIYARSRYSYLRKHYGLLNSVLAQVFLSINKTSMAIFLILGVALFLRTVNLDRSMVFIGDQGWFYLSAKDLLIQGKIPLVGITSSHIWLHQGPLWTYMLSVVLFIFKFNPVSGAYLTAIFGVLTVFLMYKLGSSLFSARVGVIAALLYAFSPLIISSDRMPFDPSPIPFFTVLFFYAICKWINGKTKYFPFILFLIAILYNLELATFTLFFPFAVILIYGVIKRESWVIKLRNKKIFLYSFAGFFVPMLPVIVYDFSHGFKQTLMFLAWTIYKPFSFLVKHSTGNFLSNFGQILSFLLSNIQKLIFQESFLAAGIIFILSLALLTYYAYQEGKIKVVGSRFLLLLLLAVSIAGILVNQTPSGAYLPIVFPFIIFSAALLFDYLITHKLTKYFALIGLFIVILTNGYVSFNDSFSNEFLSRMAAVNRIIALAKGQEYNLVGRGPGSEFSSFTMNYEYLLWWKGYAPSKSPKKLKVVVSETPKGIVVKKNYD